jgi:multiple sugar transport system permease protein
MIGTLLNILHTIKKERWAYIFLIVPLALFSIFNLLPMVATVILGLADYFPGGSPLWVGMSNYTYALSDDLFWKALWNTMLYTMGVVPISISISLVLAYLIFGLKQSIAQAIFKSAFYIPVVTSGAILSLVWLWIFNPAKGLLNYILSFLGIGPYLWTSDPQMALPSLILMAVVGGHGAAIVLLTAAMGSVPTTYYEAAHLDGASAVRQFWTITIPLLRPTLLYLVVTSTIASFQVFTQVLMMTGGGPNYATTTLVYLIYTDAFEYFDFGKAAAEATILSLGLATIAVIQYKWLSSDVEY